MFVVPRLTGSVHEWDGVCIDFVSDLEGEYVSVGLPYVTDCDGEGDGVPAGEVNELVGVVESEGLP